MGCSSLDSCCGTACVVPPCRVSFWIPGAVQSARGQGNKTETFFFRQFAGHGGKRMACWTTGNFGSMDLHELHPSARTPLLAVRCGSAPVSQNALLNMSVDIELILGVRSHVDILMLLARGGQAYAFYSIRLSHRALFTAHSFYVCINSVRFRYRTVSIIHIPGASCIETLLLLVHMCRSFGYTPEWAAQ